MIEEFNRLYRGVKTKYINRYASMFSVAWNLRKMKDKRDKLYKTVFSYAREFSETIRISELAARHVYLPEDILWRPC